MSVKTITNDLDQKTAELLNELFIKYENSSESEKLNDFLATIFTGSVHISL